MMGEGDRLGRLNNSSPYFRRGLRIGMKAKNVQTIGAMVLAGQVRAEKTDQILA